MKNVPKRIFTISPIFFEKWNWRNYTEQGIGGSETVVCELAWRLARRGYEVINYVPMPDGDPGDRYWRGTEWRDLDEADFSQPGYWMVFRSPETLDKFEKRDDQVVMFNSQDHEYGARFSPERAEKIDWYCVLCVEHYKWILERNPFLKDKLRICGNYGVKTDLIRQIEAEGPIERNPKKLVYTSSPDRGLHALLWIFKRAREWVSDLELHIFYGFDNIDKLIKFHPSFGHYGKFKEEMLRLLDTPGVHLRGRIGQTELYRELLSAGLWVYPTDFFESYCISSVEAQACGAIPITNPYGALADNVRHGLLIDGSPALDRLVKCQYAWEIRLLTEKNPEAQDAIRKTMMPDARHLFNWERSVDQWSNFLEGVNLKYFAQFQFQRRYMEGKTLNIGCGNDPCDLRAEGVINLDVVDKWPVTEDKVCKVDVLADARLPLPLEADFDSVIVGEVIEHVSENDSIKILKNARAVLRNGGRIVITVPNDGNRKPEEQHKESVEGMEFYEGAKAYHYQEITKEDIYRRVEKAGLKVEVFQTMDYNLYEGYGLVCRPVEDLQKREEHPFDWKEFDSRDAFDGLTPDASMCNADWKRR